MKRLALALFPAALVAAVLGPITGEAGGEVDRCAAFTAPRLLQDPTLAQKFHAAVEENGPAARAHLDALVDELRSAHGCGTSAADSGTGSSDAGDPHHRSSGSTGRDAQLPPGHPPIDGTPGAIPSQPLFRDPGTVTI